MRCPECDSEYVDGIVTCSDCGVPLGEERRTASETAERLVAIARTRHPDVLGDLLEALEQADIAYVIHAGTALPLVDDPEGELDDPPTWEARVWAVAERAREAIDIVNEVQQQHRQEGRTLDGPALFPGVRTR